MLQVHNLVAVKLNFRPYISPNENLELIYPLTYIYSELSEIKLS